MKTVAILGAGIAGLTCAQLLRDGGWDTTVLEKSRGPGGRASTRREGERTYDHGASFFTARTLAFQDQVRSWVSVGGVAPWTPRLVDLFADTGTCAVYTPTHPRYVGVPRMSTLARLLADGLSLQTGVQVAALQRVAPSALRVADTAGREVGIFSRVVVAVPAAQAVPLLATVAPGLATEARARAADMTPCLAVMVTFSSPLPVLFDAARLHGTSPLSWIARDSSKPGRPQGLGDSWVLHASTAWSLLHLEQPGEMLVPLLLEALRAALHLETLPPVQAAMGHRWRYALAAPEGARPAPLSLYDDAEGVGVCGDWLCAPRLEGAWRSGRHLGERLLAR